MSTHDERIRALERELVRDGRSLREWALSLVTENAEAWALAELFGVAPDPTRARATGQMTGYTTIDGRWAVDARHTQVMPMHYLEPRHDGLTLAPDPLTFLPPRAEAMARRAGAAAMPPSERERACKCPLSYTCTCDHCETCSVVLLAGEVYRCAPCNALDDLPSL